MSDTVIKVENLTKIYKLYDKPIDRLKESLNISKKKYHSDHYALRNISFEVKRGETIGIIGSNGSGKSTLLKIITGVLSPTDGDVNINGKISALLELGAGFNPEYTGIENIYLNGSMMGYNKSEIDNKLEEIVRFADIGEFIHQPVKTYSSGMFVRLAFAVAINIEPDILIVDEALSVGDIFFQSKCYKKFDEFKQKGKTILFVSHDLGSVSKYCDKAILLNKGIFIKEGSPKEIIDIYKRVLVNQYEDKESVLKEDNDNEYSSWKEEIPLNTNYLEYGNKRAEIVDFGIFDKNNILTTQLTKKEEFTLKVKVKFNDKIENPIFAFTIKDLKGNELSGTNTIKEDFYVGSIKEKSQVIICFKQNISLQSGQYLISLGCTGFEQDEFIVYHRLYDICAINIFSEKDSVGIFDMESEISMTVDY